MDNYNVWDYVTPNVNLYYGDIESVSVVARVGSKWRVEYINESNDTVCLSHNNKEVKIVISLNEVTEKWHTYKKKR